MNERRKEHRLKAHLPVKLIFQDRSEIECSTRNISRLGTYLEIERQIQRGERVELHILIPAFAAHQEAVSVACAGDVFRSDPGHNGFGTGIFFTEFPNGDHQLVFSEYIDFLSQALDREIRESVRHRREKEELRDTRLGMKDFQNEVLKCLKQVSAQLASIEEKLESPGKKQANV